MFCRKRRLYSVRKSDNFVVKSYFQCQISTVKTFIHNEPYTTDYFHNNTRKGLRPHDFQDFRSRTCFKQGFEEVVVGNLTASDTNTCTHLALACLPLMQIEIFAIAGIDNK